MTIDLNQKLKALKAVNKLKDKFNSNIKSQLMNEQVITESLTCHCLSFFDF